MNPIRLAPGGEWTRSFTYYRPVGIAVSMVIAFVVTFGFAISATKRHFLYIAVGLAALPLFLFFGTLSADGENAVFPIHLLAVVGMLPALVVGTVGMTKSLPRGGSIRAGGYQSLWLPFIAAAVACAPLVVWRNWLGAPGWLPLLSIVVGLGFVVGIGLQQRSNGAGALRRKTAVDNEL